jgi:hypothetical protein
MVIMKKSNEYSPIEVAIKVLDKVKELYKIPNSNQFSSDKAESNSNSPVGSDEINTELKEKHVDQLPGGEADSKKPEDFDPEKLAIGIKVEMEHTDDENKAREIAMDHLAENSAYYDEGGEAAGEDLGSDIDEAKEQIQEDEENHAKKIIGNVVNKEEECGKVDPKVSKAKGLKPSKLQEFLINRKKNKGVAPQISEAPKKEGDQ